jgi:hypothetical protein
VQADRRRMPRAVGYNAPPPELRHPEHTGRQSRWTERKVRPVRPARSGS